MSASTDGARADRSVAQLDMLHSLGTKLTAMRDIEEIGAAITAELRRGALPVRAR